MPLLLLLLVAVEALVLGVVLAGLGQLLGFGLGIDMTVRTRLLGRFHIFHFAERGCRANQKSAQQNGRGQDDFQMGHGTSTTKRSNCIATRLPPAFQWVCEDPPSPVGGNSPRNRRALRQLTQTPCYNQIGPKEAIASPRAYPLRSSGFARIPPVRLGAIPPETAAHCAN